LFQALAGVQTLPGLVGVWLVVGVVVGVVVAVGAVDVGAPGVVAVTVLAGPGAVTVVVGPGTVTVDVGPGIVAVAVTVLVGPGTLTVDVGPGTVAVAVAHAVAHAVAVTVVVTVVVTLGFLRGCWPPELSGAAPHDTPAIIATARVITTTGATTACLFLAVILRVVLCLDFEVSLRRLGAGGSTRRPPPKRGTTRRR
jgi:hypothetical protein